ncbi:Head-to-tail connector protein, podovirus-type [uncultured Caudovirales phage]|jgi:hypothetical protein|uniref:Head-to-tail connector protein, podovirus-type n=1 Tax=uncultured Caudovirales phage TaxID=2100421 RepID=A0A6J5MGN9_9CAUD|nr:Head-to-tail connector protein, podovirus-type [uncultured Caudovirales phage]
MESKREQFNRRLASLKTERASFIEHWRELSDYILPRQSRFVVTDRNRGDRKNSKIVDNTATLAVRTLASGMMSGITSPARPWFQLRTPDPGLNEYKPVKLWLDLVRTRMTEVFLRSNLYTTLPITYGDLGVFGTNAFAVLEDSEDVIRCYPYPIGSYMIGTSYRGNVDTCYREFQMTVNQVVGQFGIEQVSESVKNLYERGNKDAWIDVVHVVEPNDEFDERRPASKYKRFRSVYYELGDNRDRLLRESGFDDFPLMAPRWALTGEDIYGHSPAMDALGDIKALQLEQRRKAQAIDKLVNPPMTAPSSLRNQRASLLPGDVTYVDVSQGGQGFAPAYQINPRINELMMDIQENQGRIRRAFFEDLFLMIANDSRSNITAREIQERHEEKLLMLGPVLERLNDELLDPLIDRTFNIMMKVGMVPPPPQELQGMDLSVEYISVMAQAMKMVGISSIERTMQFAGQMAQANPQVLDKLDFDQALDEYSAMLGAPPSIIKDDAEVAQVRAQRAQQQNAAMAMQMAQQGAQSAKTLSETQVTDENALTNMINNLRGAPA